MEHSFSAGAGKTYGVQASLSTWKFSDIAKEKEAFTSFRSDG